MPSVLIEKLVFGGQGMGRADVPEKNASRLGAGRVVFIWGALPGEEVEFAIIKKKKNFIEGVATKILKPSPDRVKQMDEHYLSCSPWQTLAYQKENEWKKIMAEETYARIAGLNNLGLEIVAPEQEYGYRNKMEYNFSANKKGELSLAFHHRGTHWMNPIESCALANSAIQKVSSEIVAQLRAGGVPLKVLKSLVVRSGAGDKVGAVLFVTDKEYVKKYYIPALGSTASATPPTPSWKEGDIESADKNYPPLLEKGEGADKYPPLPERGSGGRGSLCGLQIYFSDPLSPASVPTELLLSAGETELEYTLNGVRLRFGLLSFFQINPGIFEMALKDIGNYVTGGRLVDYYSGVGAISLALHGKYDSALLIEENSEAIDFAADNIALNQFTNVTIQNALAEDVAPEIGSDDTVILDPPRTGLHKNVVMHLLKTQPKKIIYLSCGLDTHARDIDFLSVRYKPVFWKLYNFFPRTPHIEGLCVMERKD